MNGSKPRFLKTNTHTTNTKTNADDQHVLIFKQWGCYDLCKGERRHRGRRAQRFVPTGKSHRYYYCAGFQLHPFRNRDFVAYNCLHCPYAEVYCTYPNVCRARNIACALLLPLCLASRASVALTFLFARASQFRPLKPFQNLGRKCGTRIEERVLGIYSSDNLVGQADTRNWTFRHRLP